NRQRRFAQLVFRFIEENRLPEHLRHELLLSNKCRLWHVPLEKGAERLGEVSFTGAGREAAKALFRIACWGVKRPSFARAPIHLDSRMIGLEKAATAFAHTAHWLMVKLPQASEWPTVPYRELDKAVA